MKTRLNNEAMSCATSQAAHLATCTSLTSIALALEGSNSGNTNTNKDNNQTHFTQNKHLPAGRRDHMDYHLITLVFPNQLY